MYDTELRLVEKKKNVYIPVQAVWKIEYTIIPEKPKN